MNAYNLALTVLEESRLGVNHMIWDFFTGGGGSNDDDADDDGTIEAFNDEREARTPTTKDPEWETEEIPPDEEAKLDEDIRDGGGSFWDFFK